MRTGVIKIRIGMSATVLTSRRRLALRLSSLHIMESMGQILPMRRSFSTRALVRSSLNRVPVGVGPVCQTAQTRLVTDLICNVWKYGIEAEELAVQFIVRVRKDVILFVGGHHKVREGAASPIEEHAAVFALLGFRRLREILS